MATQAYRKLLIVGGNAGIEPSAEHFHGFLCMAENPGRFCLLSGLFGGHFGMSLLQGRILSFSAMQDSAYPMPHPRVRRSAPASHGSSRASNPMAFASTPRRAAVTDSDSRTDRRRSTRRCESGS